MDHKGHIILDLDQTLVSAEPTEEYDFSKNKNKAKKFVFHDMDGYYVVFERPGLQPFLRYLFDNFHVSIWTAASKDYALFIIDKIIIAGHQDRKIEFIFFSYHCDISEKVKKGTKDLTLLWDTFGINTYKKDNTVIIDDYDEVQDTQPKNCIAAIPFEFTDEGSERDDFLDDLTSQLRILNDKVRAGESIAPVVEQINKSTRSKSKTRSEKKE